MPMAQQYKLTPEMYTIIQFLLNYPSFQIWIGCPFWHPINRVKALQGMKSTNANQGMFFFLIHQVIPKKISFFASINLKPAPRK